MVICDGRVCFFVLAVCLYGLLLLCIDLALGIWLVGWMDGWIERMDVNT